MFFPSKLIISVPTPKLEYFSHFLLPTGFEMRSLSLLSRSLAFPGTLLELETTLSTLGCGLFTASTGVCFGTVTFSFGELLIGGIGTVGGSVYFGVTGGCGLG
ncbi:MAG: hypothetical protein AAFR77_16030 [Cyanobacteria bacterium J06631_2]